MILQKVHCFVFALFIFVGQVSGQPKTFLQVTTDVGALSIFRTHDNHFVIPLSPEVWDKCVAGTSFTSNALSRRAVHLVIEIANKSNGKCNSGIGFSCSIYRSATPIRNKINAENRFCPVSVFKNGSIVYLMFPGTVDWKSLSGNSASLPVSKN